MKLRFIGHASFCIDSDNTRVLCDPWLFGRAFNRGWALLSPSAPVDWSQIDYVWISHQHPDHLHFPTLKSVDPAERSRLTMLYQKHTSLRIPRVLKGLGYGQVFRLPLHRWLPLKSGIEVMCGSAGSMDSWIAIRADGVTVLNLNDCMIETRHLQYIARLVGRVNVLLTQFSFANWIGDHADELGEVESKLREFEERVLLFAPDVTIPFASFIYFCNEENRWMNDYVVTPRRVMDLGLPNVSFMYPGDEWDLKAPIPQSTDAVERYMGDLSRPKPIDPTPESVPAPVLKRAVDRILRQVRSRFGSILISRIAPFTIYLSDGNRLLTVDPAAECSIDEATEEARRSARYVMCSQVAWYAFAYTWGWGAMEVSGMYTDRKWREPNRLVFFLNILSTEFLDFGGIPGSARTMQFLYAKRQELWSRAVSKIVKHRGSSSPGHRHPSRETTSSPAI